MASANDKEANFSSAETCLPNFLAASCLYNRGSEGELEVMRVLIIELIF